MRRLLAVGAVAVCVVVGLPSGASGTHQFGLPHCVSTVPVAAAAGTDIGEFHTHGFGGGTVGLIQLPFVSGVTPPPSAVQADVVGALLNLNFPGLLGGGSTTIRPLAGVGGPPTTSSGAQVVTTNLFTGHFKAEPRFSRCESVLRPNTIFNLSYFEITITGLLTPTSLGSPLQQFAQGLQIRVLPGDNSPL